MLVFDPSHDAKALAQFQHSSEMLALILAASQEAIEQFGQATEVEEAFLGCWTLLHLDFLAFAFGYAGATTLPLNMVDVGLRQMVSSLAGGCYDPSCDTLLQPLTLTSCCRTHVTSGHAEALRHLLDDAYNLNVAFAGQQELLDLRVFA